MGSDNTQRPWTADLETGDAPWGRNAWVVRDGDSDPRAAFFVRGDAERYVRDRNRAAGIPTEVGDAHGEIDQNLRDRLHDLRLLTRAADRAEDFSYGDIAALEALGVGDAPKHGEEATDIGSEAEERLSEYPLCVEATTVFEVVIGTGGPDDRLLFECVGGRFDAGLDSPGESLGRYEIQRVLYRYSWSGSAEVELRGEDREVAEAFARRVVPELVE